MYHVIMYREELSGIGQLAAGKSCASPARYEQEADVTFLSRRNVGSGSQKNEKLIFGMKKIKTGAENKPWAVKRNIIVIETLVMKNIVLALEQVLKLKKSQIQTVNKIHLIFVSFYILIAGFYNSSLCSFSITDERNSNVACLQFQRFNFRALFCSEGLNYIYFTYLYKEYASPGVTSSPQSADASGPPLLWPVFVFHSKY